MPLRQNSYPSMSLAVTLPGQRAGQAGQPREHRSQDPAEIASAGLSAGLRNRTPRAGTTKAGTREPRLDRWRSRRRRINAAGWDSEAAGKAALGLLERIRPADGWLALLFLAANLCVVVLAVERADWAPTPNLVGILLLGMLTAFFLHRLPVWWFVAILPGLALGALTVIWADVRLHLRRRAAGRRGRTLEPLGPVGGSSQRELHQHRQGAIRLRDWSARRGSWDTWGPGGSCATATSGACSR